MGRLRTLGEFPGRARESLSTTCADLMNIACVIDCLGSGGAQRQLTTLGVLFRQMGHEVSFVTYHADNFFRPLLDQARIPVRELAGLGKLRRAMALRRTLRSGSQDVVLAFLEGACFYAEIAGLPSRRWGLVASERSQVPPPRRVPDWKRVLHRAADYVTTNSHAARRGLERLLPSLGPRIATIYNCVDLRLFAPPAGVPGSPDGPVRLVVAASHLARKNCLGLVRAVALARRKAPSLRLVVDWYGGYPMLPDGRPDTRYFDNARDAIRQLSLEATFRLHPAAAGVASLYHSADAVALPSFIEGLPNTVCEGMACGLPILASRVADAEILVKPGHNGFLFNPHEPESISQAILDLCALSPDQRLQMGRESRRRAEALFEPSCVAKAYEALLQAAAAKRRIRLAHWPPEAASEVQLEASAR